MHGAWGCVCVEPVVDAFFFQQARDKAVVALLVLHAVAMWRVRPDDVVRFGFLEALDRAVFEHRVEHFEHRLVLQNAGVAPLGQQPEPGSQDDPIYEIAPHPDLTRAGKTDGVALAMAFMDVAIRIQELYYDVKSTAQDVFGLDLQVF